MNNLHSPRHGGHTSRQPAGASAPGRAPIATTPVAPLLPTDRDYNLRTSAAECVMEHRQAYGQWPGRVMSLAEWEDVGAARAAKDGCTLIVGMKREGYAHPLVNLTVPGDLNAWGVTPRRDLPAQRQADIALSWSKFKGVSVVDSFRYLGLAA